MSPSTVTLLLPVLGISCPVLDVKYQLSGVRYEMPDTRSGHVL